MNRLEKPVITSVAIKAMEDMALSNHTAIDNGLERIAYSRKRLFYMPNIYIIGSDGYKKYCQVFRTLGHEMLESCMKEID